MFLHLPSCSDPSYGYHYKSITDSDDSLSSEDIDSELESIEQISNFSSVYTPGKLSDDSSSSNTKYRVGDPLVTGEKTVAPFLAASPTGECSASGFIGFSLFFYSLFL